MCLPALFAIIDSPHGICKYERNPNSFLKMFSTYLRMKEVVNSIKIFLRQIKMLTTQTREFIASLYYIIDSPYGISMKETKILFWFLQNVFDALKTKKNN